MRFYEFNKLKDFGALIRIMKGSSWFLCKTSVSASDQQQARALLRKIFGNENVLSISEIKHMPPAAEKIQLEQLIAPPSSQSVQPAQKNAHIQNSQVSGGKSMSRGRRISNRPIPDLIKHKIIQKRLSNQLLRQSNRVKPTADDLRIARDDAAIALKRANLDYLKTLKRASWRR